MKKNIIMPALNSKSAYEGMFKHCTVTPETMRYHRRTERVLNEIKKAFDEQDYEFVRDILNTVNSCMTNFTYEFEDIKYHRDRDDWDDWDDEEEL